MTCLFVVVSGVLAATAVDRLSAGGFVDAASESARAQEVLGRIGTGPPQLVLVVTAASGDVDDAEAAGAGTRLTDELAGEPGVTLTMSYWSLGGLAQLRNEEGDKALVLVRLDGNADDWIDTTRSLRDDYSGDLGQIEVAFTGYAAVYDEGTSQAEVDLAKAEGVALPVMLVALVLVFGGLVAAALPLVVGVAAVVGTALVLFLLTLFTDVSVFSLNLASILGLGLAVDYSLFIVSRFREEMRRGSAVEQAIVRTLDTAGRTVFFSGVTVAVSLLALVIFPQYFLRSFAYAGVGVVAMAVLASMLSLPALLSVVGERVDRGRLWAPRERSTERGWWYRQAKRVMRRPLLVSLTMVVFLVALAYPFLRIEFGTPDDRVLDSSAMARVAAEDLRHEFGSADAFAFPVAVEDEGSEVTTAQIDSYAKAISELSSIDRVDAPTGHYVDGAGFVLPDDPTLEALSGDGGFWLNVVPRVEPVSAEGEQMVGEIRRIEAPFDALVGGWAAELVDTKDSILGRVPWAALLIGITTFVLLFIMTGSVLIPAKAIVLNLLSLTAMFGAMVWVFQEGHGAQLLDFTATGWLWIAMPILMFCVAFGLSMDYEVFIISRVKEEYDRTGDNRESIAVGLERTGRIVTAAAALLAVPLVAMLLSGLSFLKLVGLGLALAVIVDATLVRATLMPALLAMAGRANWWAPRLLSLASWQQSPFHAKAGRGVTGSGSGGEHHEEDHGEGDAEEPEPDSQHLVAALDGPDDRRNHDHAGDDRP